MLKNLISRILIWLEQRRALITILTAALFFWQLIHLYWLTTNVVALRLLGKSFLELSDIPNILIALVDYTEIPALITATLLYFSQLYAKFNWKSLWFLVLINSQWLHLLWITDELVVNRFSEMGHTIFPVWLAWTAIFIDYLELPVIFDTLKDSFKIGLNKIKLFMLK